MLRVGLLLVLLASGCEMAGGDVPSNLTARDVVLIYGTSFGECIGYCRTELTVDGSDAVVVYRSFGDAPDVQYQRQLDVDERAALDQAFDADALALAETVYGCPDCADGGAESVGARWRGGEKTVTFEYGETVDRLGPLVEALRALRATFPNP